MKTPILSSMALLGLLLCVGPVHAGSAPPPETAVHRHASLDRLPPEERRQQALQASLERLYAAEALAWVREQDLHVRRDVYERNRGVALAEGAPPPSPPVRASRVPVMAGE